MSSSVSLRLRFLLLLFFAVLDFEVESSEVNIPFEEADLETERGRARVVGGRSTLEEERWLVWRAIQKVGRREREENWRWGFWV